MQMDSSNKIFRFQDRTGNHIITGQDEKILTSGVEQPGSSSGS